MKNAGVRNLFENRGIETYGTITNLGMIFE